MEGTPDARGLIELGRKSLTLGKPVLVWKSATSEVGAKAAQSHTANMTGRADLYRAAFRQAGLIEVDDVEPIVDIAKLVAHGRMPKGRNVGVLSISGGSGIVFADRAVEGGLVLPAFSETTVAALRQIIPAFGSIQSGRRDRRHLQRHVAPDTNDRDRAGGRRRRSAVCPAGVDPGCAGDACGGSASSPPPEPRRSRSTSVGQAGERNRRRPIACSRRRASR